MILAAPLASCGSQPSLSAYRTGFQNQRIQAQSLGRDVVTSLLTAHNKSNSQLANEFAGLASHTNQIASNLRKLDPPSKYKSQNSQLASDFTSVAGDMSSISRAATAGDAPGARAARLKLDQDLAKLGQVSRSLAGSLGLPVSR